ncbi:MAG: pyridoxal phosphate-dependent aminotransferase, partial [Paludibacter sp.]|nr:pyridoxal phosphate-dependent aminotransferase [Paludibacter sp.]
MPHTSQRGNSMPESPIRKLVPLADKAKARGVKVYHLNIGQPDLKTPQVAIDAIRNIDRKILEYSPSDGIKSLRTKLAGYYHRFNIDVTE